MKTRISNYTFNAIAGQITFSDYSSAGILLESVLLITNVTSNIIIYNFANPLLGGTVSGNVLTLDYNTATMNNADKLLIYYDDSSVPATDATIQLLQDQNALLRRMLILLNSSAVVDSGSRQKVNVDAGTVGIVGSVAVTNAGGGNNSGYNFGAGSGNLYTGLSSFSPMVVTETPVAQLWRVADSARNTFANSISSKIT